MNTAAQPTKDPVLLGLMAFVLLSSCATFVVVAEAPQTGVLVLLGLILSAVWRTPLARTSRSYVYTTLGALAAAVGQHQFLPAQTDRFFLLPGEIHCPLLLYLAVALTFFEARESIVAAVVALSVLATMIAGNVVNFGGERSLLPNLVADMYAFHRFYGMMVLVQILAILVLLGRASRQQAQDALPKRGWLARTVVLAMCMALVGLLVAAMYVGAARFHRRFQYAMASFLQRYARNRGPQTLFSRQVDLWRTADSRTANDQTVVLRVRANRIPGYLRGYTYTAYAFGRWSADGVYQALPVRDQPRGHITFRVYERFPDPTADERLDILPATGFRSEVLLLPGEASRIEIIAGELRTTKDGEIAAGDWERATGYVAVAPRIPAETAFPRPARENIDRDAYLHVPDYLRSALEDIADEAFADLPEAATTDAILAAVRSYLKRTCRYDLEVDMDPLGGDPVVQFLTRWQRGHCELFAASAALLLRLRGIPARYVTGFVCNEQPPGTGHYVARRADAHAWAEAYNEDRGRWELVEATPGEGIPGGDSRTSLLAAWIDALRLAWQRTLALMKRGYVAQALAALAMGLFGALLWFFANPWRAAGAAALIGGIVFGLRQRVRRRRLTRIRELGMARWQLRHSHRRLLRQFRKYGLAAGPADTLRRMLARLDATRPEQAAWLHPLIAEYERLRYGCEQPSAEAVRHFERRLRRHLRQAG